MFYITDKITDFKSDIEKMLLPKFVFFIFNNKENNENITFAAVSDSSISGIITGVPDTGDSTTYTITYLYVKKEFRNSSVGSALFEEFKEKAKSKGYKKIGVIADFDRKSTELSGFKKFMKKKGIPDFILQKTAFVTTSTDFEKEKWFSSILPPDYEIVKWMDISEEEKGAIKANEETFSKLDRATNDFYQSPFIQNGFEALTSLAVKKKSENRIVGWNITELNEAGFVVYRKLYVVPEERNKGLLMALMSRSIYDSMRNFNGACFIVQGINKKMRIGIDIMMGHLCDKIIETYAAVMELR